MAEKLTELFHCMWRKEAIPQEFKDASIIHLYKRKGNPQVCDNHRHISLLSIAGKILAKILLNRLNAHLDQTGLIPESQCGFRKDRGTIDMIFTARQLQEKCQEQNVDLYIFFFFFFFDSVLRPFQDYFSSYETGQSVGGAKTGEPREKPPDTPASRTWLVSHVARAGLEPTPVTAVR